MVRIRARANYVGTKVNHSAIERMFLPGGAIYREAGRLGSSMVTEARAGLSARGSNRSGRTAASLSHATTPGRLSVYSTLYSRHKSTKWYHEGTRPIITARTGGAMKVPRNRRARLNMSENPGQPYVLKARVRGQFAKPFMTNAMRRALARRGIV